MFFPHIADDIKQGSNVAFLLILLLQYCTFIKDISLDVMLKWKDIETLGTKFINCATNSSEIDKCIGWRTCGCYEEAAVLTKQSSNNDLLFFLNRTY